MLTCIAVWETREVIFSPISLLHNGFHMLENLLLGAALVPGPGLPGPGRNLECQVRVID